MRISIVGWYSSKNVGDEAFRFVLPQFFPGHDIEFVKPPNHAKNPDLVVLGGGAVASPFYLNTLPDCLRYAIGIDLAYESEADLLAKANFQIVYIRNKSDLERLRLKLTCPVVAIPDLAFLLKPTGISVLHRYKLHPNKKTIGVFVTDYVNPAIDRPIKDFAEKSFSFKINLAKELDILSEENYEIILIPCATGGYGDDRRINLDLAAFMAHRPTLIFDTLNPQEMIDLIVDLNGCICQRFHAHIFSIIADTPFASIDYTRKVKLLLEENNLLHTCGARFEGIQFNASNLRNTLGVNMATFQSEIFLKLAEDNYNHLKRTIQQVQQAWLPRLS